MKLTIQKIFRKDKETQYGLKQSVGLKTLEYGDKWVNGWGDENNKDWKEGDVVEADITLKGEYINFKAVGTIKPSLSTQIARTGRVADLNKNDDDKKEKEAYGKCKHAFLVEAYKATIAGQINLSLAEIEEKAELWADMSMRKMERSVVTGNPVNINIPQYDNTPIQTDDIPF